MPRKSLKITNEFPYHIRARSNNKEWFYLPMDQCWNVFEGLLLEINVRFDFQTHAFVLMNNHYHLIGTASEHYPLPKVMEWFQRSANRIINNKAGRINHLFGGPYRATLITHEYYYLHAIKYVYRNPVEAGLVGKVEKYPYSSLINSFIPLVSPTSGINSCVPSKLNDLLEFLNEAYSGEAQSALRRALKRTEFEISGRINKVLKEELCRRS